MTPDIDIRALVVTRGGRRVLHQCTLGFARGEVHAVVGHNGAGKTTLFETIFGFLAPDSGAMLLDGRPLTAHDVAYLPTDLYLYSGVTGRELLLLFARARTLPARAEQQAAAFDLPLDALIDSYSFGTRRKLALTAVLGMPRSLLLLDEPFEGLDVVSRRIVRRLLRDAADAGQAVAFSAHETEALPSFSDRISLLRDGRISGQYPGITMPEVEALLTIDVEERLDALRDVPRDVPRDEARAITRPGAPAPGRPRN